MGSPFWPLLPSLSQDTDTEATAMVVDMVMEVMATEDTEVTMARDPLMLMLSQDTTDMEVMVLVMDMAVMVLVIEDMDTEVTMARDLLMLRLMPSQDTMVMDMVEDITDKKLVHIYQLKAINHKFYFKTDSF